MNAHAPTAAARFALLIDDMVTQPDTPWSELMARAQGGDTKAYRALLVAITPYLRAIASRIGHRGQETDDLVQDILLTVHEVRHTYDAGRPFKPWLAAIARHRAVDRLRRHARVSAYEVTLLAEHEAFAADMVPDEIDSARLARFIERLPTGQRQALRLLKLQEKSLQEASAESGHSVAALKVATHRGIKALRLMFNRPGKPT